MAKSSNEQSETFTHTSKILQSNNDTRALLLQIKRFDSYCKEQLNPREQSTQRKNNNPEIFKQINACLKPVRMMCQMMDIKGIEKDLQQNGPSQELSDRCTKLIERLTSQEPPTSRPPFAEEIMYINKNELIKAYEKALEAKQKPDPNSEPPRSGPGF